MNGRYRQKPCFLMVPMQTRKTRIHLDEMASFIGWDMLVSSVDKARGEIFQQGQYQGKFRLYRADKLLVAADAFKF